jgi:predicted SPOUT superfamily RNA methylase MTH1
VKSHIAETRISKGLILIVFAKPSKVVMRTNYDSNEMLEFFYSNHRNLFPDDKVEKIKAEQIVLTMTLNSEYSRYEDYKLISEIKLQLEKHLASK